MRSDRIRLTKSPKEEAAETARAVAYERKQRWKELPGNRYTPEKLRQMSAAFADCTMHRSKRRIMFIA